MYNEMVHVELKKVYLVFTAPLFIDTKLAQSNTKPQYTKPPTCYTTNISSSTPFYLSNTAMVHVL